MQTFFGDEPSKETLTISSDDFASKMADSGRGSSSFNIPKLKKNTYKDNLQPLDLKNRDVQNLLKDLNKCCLDINFSKEWEMVGISMVHNADIEARYSKKRAELKDDGRSTQTLSDQLGFLHVQSYEKSRIAKEGLQVKRLAYNKLGKSDLGVYLNRFFDLEVRSAWTSESLAYKEIFIFKYFPGKCKSINIGSPYSVCTNLEPTPNYDSHISHMGPQHQENLFLQRARSRVYLYEYTEECEASKSPRHVRPFAIIKVKQKKVDNVQIDAVPRPLSAPQIGVSTNLSKAYSSVSEKPTETNVPPSLSSTVTKTPFTSSSFPDTPANTRNEEGSLFWPRAGSGCLEQSKPLHPLMSCQPAVHGSLQSAPREPFWSCSNSRDPRLAPINAPAPTAGAQRLDPRLQRRQSSCPDGSGPSQPSQSTASKGEGGKSEGKRKVSLTEYKMLKRSESETSKEQNLREATRDTTHQAAASQVSSQGHVRPLFQSSLSAPGYVNFPLTNSSANNYQNFSPSAQNQSPQPQAFPPSRLASNSGLNCDSVNPSTYINMPTYPPPVMTTGPPHQGIAPAGPTTVGDMAQPPGQGVFTNSAGGSPKTMARKQKSSSQLLPLPVINEDGSVTNVFRGIVRGTVREVRLPADVTKKQPSADKTKPTANKVQTKALEGKVSKNIQASNPVQSDSHVAPSLADVTNKTSSVGKTNVIEQKADSKGHHENTLTKRDGTCAKMFTDFIVATSGDSLVTKPLEGVSDSKTKSSKKKVDRASASGLGSCSKAVDGESNANGEGKFQTFVRAQTKTTAAPDALMAVESVGIVTRESSLENVTRSSSHQRLSEKICEKKETCDETGNALLDRRIASCDASSSLNDFAATIKQNRSIMSSVLKDVQELISRRAKEVVSELEEVNNTSPAPSTTDEEDEENSPFRSLFGDAESRADKATHSELGHEVDASGTVVDKFWDSVAAKPQWHGTAGDLDSLPVPSKPKVVAPPLRLIPALLEEGQETAENEDDSVCVRSSEATGKVQRDICGRETSLSVTDISHSIMEKNVGESNAEVQVDRDIQVCAQSTLNVDKTVSEAECSKSQSDSVLVASSGAHPSGLDTHQPAMWEVDPVLSRLKNLKPRCEKPLPASKSLSELGIRHYLLALSDMRFQPEVTVVDYRQAVQDDFHLSECDICDKQLDSAVLDSEGVTDDSSGCSAADSFKESSTISKDVAPHHRPLDHPRHRGFSGPILDSPDPCLPSDPAPSYQPGIVAVDGGSASLSYQTTVPHVGGQSGTSISRVKPVDIIRRVPSRKTVTIVDTSPKGRLEKCLTTVVGKMKEIKSVYELSRASVEFSVNRRDSGESYTRESSKPALNESSKFSEGTTEMTEPFVEEFDPKIYPSYDNENGDMYSSAGGSRKKKGLASQKRSSLSLRQKIPSKGDKVCQDLDTDKTVDRSEGQTSVVLKPFSPQISTLPESEGKHLKAQEKIHDKDVETKTLVASRRKKDNSLLSLVNRKKVCSDASKFYTNRSKSPARVENKLLSSPVKKALKGKVCRQGHKTHGSELQKGNSPLKVSSLVKKFSASQVKTCSRRILSAPLLNNSARLSSEHKSKTDSSSQIQSAKSSKLDKPVVAQTSSAQRDFCKTSLVRKELMRRSVYKKRAVVKSNVAEKSKGAALPAAIDISRKSAVPLGRPKVKSISQSVLLELKKKKMLNEQTSVLSERVENIVGAGTNSDKTNSVSETRFAHLQENCESEMRSPNLSVPVSGDSHKEAPASVSRCAISSAESSKINRNVTDILEIEKNIHNPLEIDKSKINRSSSGFSEVSKNVSNTSEINKDTQGGDPTLEIGNWFKPDEVPVGPQKKNDKSAVAKGISVLEPLAKTAVESYTGQKAAQQTEIHATISTMSLKPVLGKPQLAMMPRSLALTKKSNPLKLQRNPEISSGEPSTIDDPQPLISLRLTAESQKHPDESKRRSEDSGNDVLPPSKWRPLCATGQDGEKNDDNQPQSSILGQHQNLLGSKALLIRKRGPLLPTPTSEQARTTTTSTHLQTQSSREHIVADKPKKDESVFASSRWVAPALSHGARSDLESTGAQEIVSNSSQLSLCDSVTDNGPPDSSTKVPQRKSQDEKVLFVRNKVPLLPHSESCQNPAFQTAPFYQEQSSVENIGSSGKTFSDSTNENLHRLDGEIWLHPDHNPRSTFEDSYQDFELPFGDVDYRRGPAMQQSQLGRDDSRQFRNPDFQAPVLEKIQSEFLPDELNRNGKSKHFCPKDGSLYTSSRWGGPAMPRDTPTTVTPEDEMYFTNPEHNPQDEDLRLEMQSSFRNQGTVVRNVWQTWMLQTHKNHESLSGSAETVVSFPEKDLLNSKDQTAKSLSCSHPESAKAGEGSERLPAQTSDSSLKEAEEHPSILSPSKVILDVSGTDSAVHHQQKCIDILNALKAGEGQTPQRAKDDFAYSSDEEDKPSGPGPFSVPECQTDVVSKQKALQYSLASTNMTFESISNAIQKASATPKLRAADNPHVLSAVKGALQTLKELNVIDSSIPGLVKSSPTAVSGHSNQGQGPSSVVAPDFESSEKPLPTTTDLNFDHLDKLLKYVKENDILKRVREVSKEESEQKECTEKNAAALRNISEASTQDSKREKFAELGSHYDKARSSVDPSGEFTGVCLAQSECRDLGERSLTPQKSLTISKENLGSRKSSLLEQNSPFEILKPLFFSSETNIRDDELKASEEKPQEDTETPKYKTGKGPILKDNEEKGKSHSRQALSKDLFPSEGTVCSEETVVRKASESKIDRNTRVSANRVPHKDNNTHLTGRDDDSEDCTTRLGSQSNRSLSRHSRSQTPCFDESSNLSRISSTSAKIQPSTRSKSPVDERRSPSRCISHRNPSPSERSKSPGSKRRFHSKSTDDNISPSRSKFLESEGRFPVRSLSHRDGRRSPVRSISHRDDERRSPARTRSPWVAARRSPHRRSWDSYSRSPSPYRPRYSRSKSPPLRGKSSLSPARRRNRRSSSRGRVRSRSRSPTRRTRHRISRSRSRSSTRRVGYSNSRRRSRSLTRRTRYTYSRSRSRSPPYRERVRSKSPFNAQSGQMRSSTSFNRTARVDSARRSPLSMFGSPLLSSKGSQSLMSREQAGKDDKNRDSDPYFWFTDTISSEKRHGYVQRDSKANSYEDPVFRVDEPFKGRRPSSLSRSRSGSQEKDCFPTRQNISVSVRNTVVPGGSNLPLEPEQGKLFMGDGRAGTSAYRDEKDDSKVKRSSKGGDQDSQNSRIFIKGQKKCSFDDRDREDKRTATVHDKHGSMSKRPFKDKKKDGGDTRIVVRADDMGNDRTMLTIKRSVSKGEANNRTQCSSLSQTDSNIHHTVRETDKRTSDTDKAEHMSLPTKRMFNSNAEPKIAFLSVSKDAERNAMGEEQKEEKGLSASEDTENEAVTEILTSAPIDVLSHARLKILNEIKLLSSLDEDAIALLEAEIVPSGNSDETKDQAEDAEGSAEKDLVADERIGEEDSGLPEEKNAAGDHCEDKVKEKNVSLETAKKEEDCDKDDNERNKRKVERKDFSGEVIDRSHENAYERKGGPKGKEEILVISDSDDDHPLYWDEKKKSRFYKRKYCSSVEAESLEEGEVVEEVTSTIGKKRKLVDRVVEVCTVEEKEGENTPSLERKEEEQKGKITEIKSSQKSSQHGLRKNVLNRLQSLKDSSLLHSPHDLSSVSDGEISSEREMAVSPPSAPCYGKWSPISDTEDPDSSSKSTETNQPNDRRKNFVLPNEEKIIIGIKNSPEDSLKGADDSGVDTRVIRMDYSSENDCIFVGEERFQDSITFRNRKRTNCDVHSLDVYNLTTEEEDNQTCTEEVQIRKRAEEKLDSRGKKMDFATSPVFESERDKGAAERSLKTSRGAKTINEKRESLRKLPRDREETKPYSERGRDTRRDADEIARRYRNRSPVHRTADPFSSSENRGLAERSYLSSRSRKGDSYEREHRDRSLFHRTELTERAKHLERSSRSGCSRRHKDPHSPSRTHGHYPKSCESYQSSRSSRHPRPSSPSTSGSRDSRGSSPHRHNPASSPSVRTGLQDSFWRQKSSNSPSGKDKDSNHTNSGESEKTGSQNDQRLKSLTAFNSVSETERQERRQLEGAGEYSKGASSSAKIYNDVQGQSSRDEAPGEDVTRATDHKQKVQGVSESSPSTKKTGQMWSQLLTSIPKRVQSHTNRGESSVDSITNASHFIWPSCGRLQSSFPSASGPPVHDRESPSKAHYLDFDDADLLETGNSGTGKVSMFEKVLKEHRRDRKQTMKTEDVTVHNFLVSLLGVNCEIFSHLLGWPLDTELGSRAVSASTMNQLVALTTECAFTALKLDLSFIDPSFGLDDVCFGNPAKLKMLREFSDRQIVTEVQILEHCQENFDIEVGVNEGRRSREFKLESLQLVVTALNDLRRYSDFGEPHCRVPGALLLKSERRSWFSVGNCFLIMLLPMSQELFSRLLSLKHSIEKLGPENTSGETEEMRTKLISERARLLKTNTGSQNVGRERKLRDELACFRECRRYLRHVIGNAAVENMTVFNTYLDRIAWHIQLMQMDL
ncbi:uncharacterized protein LOC101846779 [Aplysia californica]|uniref:Uncharacterized protein LOC101846779 n=1 Tax=Aplysia californica TaxID=6500 RepID=A0ABM0JAL8_APLCA|nr:uncharacterized protein LOC101846779 [Aplysia californica]